MSTVSKARGLAAALGPEHLVPSVRLAAFSPRNPPPRCLSGSSINPTTRPPAVPNDSSVASPIRPAAVLQHSMSRSPSDMCVGQCIITPDSAGQSTRVYLEVPAFRNSNGIRQTSTLD